MLYAGGHAKVGLSLFKSR